jgi:AraC family ethanolamine operon transcriptional activator
MDAHSVDDGLRVGPRVDSRVSQDVDEITAGLSGVQAEIWVAERPSGAAWELLNMDVSGLQLMYGRMAGSFCARAGVHDGSLLVALKLDAGHRWNLQGRPFTEHEITIVGPGTEYTLRTAAPGEWAILRLDALEIEERIMELSDGARAHIRDSLRVWRPRAEALQHLRCGLYRLIQSTATDEKASCMNDLGAALRAEVLDGVAGAMVRCDAPPHGNVTRVVQRAMSYLDAHRGRPVYVSDLCVASACSERALRRAFHAIYDMSPIDFVRTRKLNLVRRALLEGRCKSVTEAAMLHGFFDFGRFAGAYRNLFGELPSMTAERAAH